jgi:hypothetical protein
MDAKLLTVSLSMNDIIRLFSKIVVQPSGCWEWKGHRFGRGYGRTSLNGKLIIVHRLFYAWAVGPIPTGCSKNTPNIDHLCRNRACCNPVHLELVSLKENVRRGYHLTVNLNGVVKSISEWADEINIPYATIVKRLKSGWTPERTLTEPININKRRTKLVRGHQLI